MSLRFRLICLNAIVLIARLAVEGTIVSFNASRSVQTEINSALHVGQQIIKSALARLPNSLDPRRDLETLVAAFKGNRHLRASLTGNGEATVKPSVEGSHFGTVPPWFVRFLGITPIAARVPIAIAGQDYGSIPPLPGSENSRSRKIHFDQALRRDCLLQVDFNFDAKRRNLFAMPEHGARGELAVFQGASKFEDIEPGGAHSSPSKST